MSTLQAVLGKGKLTLKVVNSEVYRPCEIDARVTKCLHLKVTMDSREFSSDIIVAYSAEIECLLSD